ncbi:ABC transporter permease [bacterium]|nr:ABC transporter permease [bacterium]
MEFIDFLKTSFNTLMANKTRSFLTTLGIVIGISSVIVMVSIGSGAQKLIVNQISAMGSNTIFIEPGAFDPKKSSMTQTAIEEAEVKTLKYSDALAISKLPGVEMVAPWVMGVETVVYQDKNKRVTFIGTTPENQKIDGTSPILGRGLEDGDVKSMDRVVLLGYKVSKDLFGDENPIGKTLRIKNINFKVIGVLEEKGGGAFMNPDDYIYLPLTTAQKLLLGIDYVRVIVVKAESEQVIDSLVQEMREILRQRHHIFNPENDLAKDDFKITTQVEATEMLSSVLSVLTLFLSSVAAIALVVGGIGIMNIMFVSVTERTKEIGLRKAVGARKKDILIQFLVEAVVLTFLGGIGGIILGAGVSFLAGLILGHLLNQPWVFVLSVKAIIIAVSISVGTGLVFGIYPAYKAANLSPIQALRYE